jgi:hypothetical protein
MKISNNKKKYCIYICINICYTNVTTNVSTKYKGDERMGAKKSSNYRLHESTREQIAYFAKKKGVSQADFISVLVHAYYMEWDREKLDEFLEFGRKLREFNATREITVEEKVRYGEKRARERLLEE